MYKPVFFSANDPKVLSFYGIHSTESFSLVAMEPVIAEKIFSQQYGVLHFFPEEGVFNQVSFLQFLQKAVLDAYSECFENMVVVAPKPIFDCCSKQLLLHPNSEQLQHLPNGGEVIFFDPHSAGNHDIALYKSDGKHIHPLEASDWQQIQKVA